jgi:hypothetical protein
VQSILELTVDSIDDGRRLEAEDEVETANGTWPEPEQPGPRECRTPAAGRLVTRMHCEHLPYRRDSIALSTGGRGIVGGLLLTDRDFGTGWFSLLQQKAIGGRFMAPAALFDFRRLRLQLTDDAVTDEGAATSGVVVVVVVEPGLLITGSGGSCGSDAMNRWCLASSQSGNRNRSPEPS